MKRILSHAGGLVVVLALLFAPGTAFGDGPVDPPMVIQTLHPGESIEVEKQVTTPDIPPVIDICLVEDETGSFADDIAILQALAGPGGPLISALDATGSDYATCVIGFRDFDQSTWGSSGDWVYRRLANVTPGGGGFVAGVPLLTAGGGADSPEAQLEALHYLATPGHAAIDSNGDGDSVDPNDTPAGQQPTWRSGSQRVVLLATDADCHVTGDTGGWPGDAGTTSPAVTAGLLNSAGITVIGLTPGGPGTIACVDALASGTGGSVHATGASGETIVEAILAGLEELTTDVWHEAVCDPGLNVTLTPEVHEDVAGNTMVVFNEQIEVPNTTAPGDYHCTVSFVANEFPIEGELVGQQDIWITVVAIPVAFDIKPQSCPNPLNCKGGGVLPAAIVGTEDLDVTTIDAASIQLEGVSALRWDFEDVATPHEPFLGKQDCDNDCTTQGPDGFLDLTLKFDKQEVLAALEAAGFPLEHDACLLLTMDGNFNDGRAIEGQDVVRFLCRGAQP